MKEKNPYATYQAHQIAVPLNEKEIQRLDKYLIKTGLKKGRFVRDAIMEKLEREVI